MRNADSIYFMADIEQAYLKMKFCNNNNKNDSILNNNKNIFNNN